MLSANCISQLGPDLLTKQWQRVHFTAAVHDHFTFMSETNLIRKLQMYPLSHITPDEVIFLFNVFKSFSLYSYNYLFFLCEVAKLIIYKYNMV